MAMTTATGSPVDARERFRRLADQWKSESQYMSNTTQMAMLWSYQNIIGMGDQAIPFILEEMQSEPNQWFWALEAITASDPVPKEVVGKVEPMIQAWIEWGIQNGYTSR